MHKKLLEFFRPQDFKWATPTEDDFKKVAEAYEDYMTNGAIRQPKALVRSTYGEIYEFIRLFVVSAFFKWTEAIEEFKKYTKEIGLAMADIKEVIQHLRANPAVLNELYEKHCEPALSKQYSAPTTSKSQAAPNSSSTPAQTATTSSNNLQPTIKILAKPGATFCRIVAYDPKYSKPVRRHIYLTKKQGNSYKVSIGSAEVTSWFNEPFFDSITQAEDFIKNIAKATTKTNVTSFEYSITDKPVASGTSIIISDLSNCVLITSDCGPAYIHKKNQYCVEGLTEEVEVEEAIEKHEELNPVLFENNKLKTEIREKCLEIVDTFLEDFNENEIELAIKDIIITGSNANYNYTKDSDLDIHIVADTTKLEDPNSLYPLIYDAYRSLFNKRLDIKFYDIPVEVYVETQVTPLVSNGIYSVKTDEWVKEPVAENIPEVDQKEINKALKPWENRYKTLINKIDETEDTDDAEIEKYITELYKLRHKGLSSEGEFSIGNLVFKEIRNKGYLDNLKDLKNKLLGNKLSIVESYNKSLSEKDRREYYNTISQLTHYQPIIQVNGLFELYNVKETDLPFVKAILTRQNFIDYVQVSGEKFDFNKVSFQGIPNKKYKLTGKIKF